MKITLSIVSIAVSLALLPSASTAQGNCESGWFDTHIHYNDADYMETALARLDQYEVNCAVLLNMELKANHPNRSYRKLANFLTDHPRRFFPFFTTYGEDASDNRLSEVKTAVGDHVTTFSGLGESAFYSNEFSEIELTSTMWHKLFRYAGNHDLILMIHLRPGQAEDLATMLATYPDTTVLMHGAEIYESLDTLLTDYDNLYYTLDTSILLWGSAGNLMYPTADGNAATFRNSYDANAETLLVEAQTKWYDLIAAHPRKVMWGTDISEEWHLNAGVYRRLHAFSEDFADGLDDHLERNYRRKNAVRLFNDHGLILQ